jgi:tellurite resistance protein TerC
VDVTLTAWTALIGGLVALLLLDLLVLHRHPEAISIRDAAWSTAGFIGISVVFGVCLGLVEGASVAEQFFAGYLLEKSLSFDNVFVWALIFSAFAIPEAYQHRVLFIGLFSALALRGAFVAAGNELLERFEWVVYAFGALLIWSSLRLLRRGASRDPEASPALRFLRRALPTTRRPIGPRLLVRASDVPAADRPPRRALFGRWYATPLLAVLVAIEAADIVFAVDSIPAIFGVTREPFIVFSATAFALLGLRSLYFLLAGVRVRFHYLDTGLAVILGFVGVKFLVTDVVEIDPAVSLAVVVGVLTTAIAASLLRRSR